MRLKFGVITCFTLMLILSSFVADSHAEEVWNLISDPISYKSFASIVDAQGQLTTSVASSTGESLISTAVGDFIGDSNNDLAIGYATGDAVYILEGNGSTFSNTSVITIQGASGSKFGTSVERVDNIDGDVAKSEVLVGASSEGKVYLFRSNLFSSLDRPSTISSTLADLTFVYSGATDFGQNVIAVRSFLGAEGVDIIVSASVTDGTVYVYSDINASVGLLTSPSAIIVGS
ncbi:hypothetical protein ACFL2A_04405, partial [Thermodesulfobacteriota bacterium]